MAWTAIGIGAALGAWLRWGIGKWLILFENPWPWGTLVVNLLGSYLMGFAVGFFNDHTTLSSVWRYFIITGFLGGFTTFSSFSAESIGLIEKGQYFWVSAHGILHTVGSIGCCLLGLMMYREFNH